LPTEFGENTSSLLAVHRYLRASQDSSSRTLLPLGIDASQTKDLAPLLRTSRNRPRDRGAAKNADELPPLH
jgi:hypothetical protein